jgi:hypothetical protein
MDVLDCSEKVEKRFLGWGAGGFEEVTKGDKAVLGEEAAGGECGAEEETGVRRAILKGGSELADRRHTQKKKD